MLLFLKTINLPIDGFIILHLPLIYKKKNEQDHSLISLLSNVLLCPCLTAFTQQWHNWVKTQAGVFSRFFGTCIAVDQQDHNKARFKLSTYLALTKLASDELLVVILSFNSVHQCQCQCSVPDMNFSSCQLSLAIKESRHFSAFLNMKSDSFGKYFHFCKNHKYQFVFLNSFLIYSVDTKRGKRTQVSFIR